MILPVSQHVSNAQVQCLYYKALVCKARLDCKNNLSHSDRSYTFVVDYGQNMEVPFFGETQPGDSYYYTPMSVYNLGVVNSGHLHDGENEPKDHMHCHVYDEGIAGKGSNNVASLIMKTLHDLKLLKNDESGGELNIFFANCSGQNKNNTVLKLVPFLVEMEYFKGVNFVFLVVDIQKTLQICSSMY